MIADKLVNFKSRSTESWIVPLYKSNTIWFFWDGSHNRTKNDITKLWKRHVSINCNFSKELWFPGMGTKVVKKWKIYCLITLKQFQKALPRDIRCFDWVKISLFKVVMLHNLE